MEPASLRAARQLVEAKIIHVSALQAAELIIREVLKPRVVERPPISFDD